MKDVNYRDWVCGKLEIGRQVLYLKGADCRGLGIPNREVLALAERSMILCSEQQIEMPPKIGLHPLPQDSAVIDTMPAFAPETELCSMKWVAAYPQNRERFGLPQTSALLLLNDMQSGALLCIMDATYITVSRTAAVAVLCGQRFGKQPVKSFGQIGCGAIGSRIVSMLGEALPELTEIHLMDVAEPAMERVIQNLQPQSKAKIYKSSYREIAENCDVISSACMTKIPEPQIKDKWLHAGQTLVLTDAHFMFEDATFARADKYLTDCLAQYEIKSRNYSCAPAVYAENGTVFSGRLPGRENEQELIVCNNLGMAVTDLLLARYMFDAALKADVGQLLDL